MLQRRAVVAILAVAACWLALLPAAAQDPSQLVGQIPGTDMMRDEFRARAQAQLKAVALSAHAYRLMDPNDLWPTNYYELRNSQAWGFDLLNMFSGLKVQAIYYEPREDDFTSKPVFDVPMELYTPSGPTIADLVPDGEPDPEAFGQLFAQQAPTGIMRVDPAAVREFNPGDIYYYVSGDLLQLVLYAPDGSFFEHVDTVPNTNWLSHLRTPAGSLWPDSILAAQLLYFAERVLPQHYNLTMFMGDQETIPTSWYESLTPAERLDLGLELGIVILNPFSREPVAVMAQHSNGDLVTLDPEHPVPLTIGLRDGQVWTLDQLHSRQPAVEAEVEAAPKRRTKPSRPPLGGR